MAPPTLHQESSVTVPPTSSPPVNARSKPITKSNGIDTFGTLNQLPSRHMSYQIGVSAAQGQRGTMEDTYGFVVDFDAVHGQGLFAVFDGHGNQLAAEWCGTEFHQHILSAIRSHPNAAIADALSVAFDTMDKALSHLSNTSEAMASSGSTAVTAFLRIEDVNRRQPFMSTQQESSLERTSRPSEKASITPPTTCRRVLYCANVGDSRAVLSRGGEPMRLTHDHRTSDIGEAARIRNENGVIFNGRVNGYVNVTRSLGDHICEGDYSLKKCIISVPYTSRTELVDEDEFLILACDGLWDVISDLEAVQHIQHIEDAEIASLALLDLALAKGTHDNVTVIVVWFKPFGVA
ncbi:phosphatase 2C-like domain-containing protein [Collybia nuda]|uniref:Phosphatase 2C-like domain-containing protein n=1 Tax=Collybia nuda TaxID=64659 RepID=A0A9P6CD02_9AGAR|nr:phosphatase 2C-like domain-containing protein [Collybia nuda]